MNIQPWWDCGRLQTENLKLWEVVKAAEKVANATGPEWAEAIGELSEAIAVLREGEKK